MMFIRAKDFLASLQGKLNKRKKIVLLAGLAVIIATMILGSWLLKTGFHGTDDNVRLKIIPENVDLQIKNIHFTEVGDPDLTWEIRADTARFVRKDNLAYFDRVEIRLIRADGKTVTLTGKEGVLHTDTRNAEVTGQVVVVSNSGDIVETDRLYYSHADRRIFTDSDQKITLRNARMVITGIGMSLTLADQKVTLMSGVTGTIQQDTLKR